MGESEAGVRGGERLELRYFEIELPLSTSAGRVAAAADGETGDRETLPDLERNAEGDRGCDGECDPEGDRGCDRECEGDRDRDGDCEGD